MAEAQVGLSRSLGLFDVTLIGVGAMIGAGIFVLTGIAADIAGPAVLLAFALNGLVTLLTAMTYAELGSALPEAGGGYLWVKHALGDLQSFIAGWMSWFAHAVAGALYALGFGSYAWVMLEEYLHFVAPTPGSGPVVLSVAVTFLFLYINYRGARATGRAGNIVTLAKLAIILLFIVGGLFAIGVHPERLDSFEGFFADGWTAVLAAMGLTFIAFEGYEIIAQAGEEVRDPRKNIPRAIFLSLLIVVPFYILTAFAAIGAVVPPAGAGSSAEYIGSAGELGLLRAAEQFMPLGGALLIIGALVSTMSALNATTFSSTRVAFAMGRDRILHG
ncbi:MAG TPA: APC family permease, partial [Candidatus Thermoplasmatota archaeon]